MASNININYFDKYVFKQLINENNGRLLSNNFHSINIYSSNYEIAYSNLDLLYYDLIESNNNSNTIHSIYNYYSTNCNFSFRSEVSNNSINKRFSIDNEGLLVYSNGIKTYNLYPNDNGIILEPKTIENDSYHDYKIRYDYFKELVKFIDGKNLKTIDISTFLTASKIPSKSPKLVLIDHDIKNIFKHIQNNSTSINDKDLIKDSTVFIHSLKYYYYIAILVITHYIITNINSINTDQELLKDFNAKISLITTDIENFNVDNADIIKNEITINDDKYKKNNDSYTIKNNQLTNIVNSNLYNNIFLYITIIVLILICLGIIYINNHKNSLKTQYSIAVITFLLLYYIIYTNVTINIENFAIIPENNETLLDNLIRKIIAYLEIIKNNEPYIKSLLEKEKNKYANYAKSSKSKIDNLKILLNDEFINAIKSKELIKFLILFTTICIICFIVQTNVEDLTTTSIIFIILFIIILSIYYYNINIMTRTKHDNKYWTKMKV
jgi:hypothetical protein